MLLLGSWKYLTRSTVLSSQYLEQGDSALAIEKHLDDADDEEDEDDEIKPVE